MKKKERLCDNCGKNLKGKGFVMHKIKPRAKGSSFAFIFRKITPPEKPNFCSQDCIFAKWEQMIQKEPAQ